MAAIKTVLGERKRDRIAQHVLRQSNMEENESNYDGEDEEVQK
eukprot:CAMPEP_0197828172 /NCGR_PEP_ID=MMETSP1437-20131217/4813_1 /TAXON_ID=49252 ORGANISM="Eucampia antarctica, Strain CCMP1452" /NCGR_SAMPLE_ID=MMETSP1437 /ASSEMBLY_ACC=CAM_ASM_001096 /LENGTH=42 /DNA_ID= /DNA_START= /DNA_END= /DNA_ORIENTATION=